MYERLLRIMMLSVTRQTSMPVKFWLFENYLSPSFKHIGDHILMIFVFLFYWFYKHLKASAMAAQYGFEVAYVTYKWPQWLNQQTQQQRIIWGYKILFLDVLFPLHVKKVSTHFSIDCSMSFAIICRWYMSTQTKLFELIWRNCGTWIYRSHNISEAPREVILVCY